MACGKRILKKLNQTEKAFRKLKGIESLTDELDDEILYEVSAKRFEYTFESLWKTVLEEKGIISSSPMDCFKQFYKTMNLDEKFEDKIPKTVKFRNEIVHIYDYETAEFIYKNLENNVIPHFGRNNC